jgi:hypothetical protein
MMIVQVIEGVSGNLCAIKRYAPFFLNDLAAS